ncbi:MAG: hypothetical protein K5796_05960 [Lachnospiraceae bacterium]|nr:hypothetical protein [Lachnospiraceae bacterium]
MQKNVKLNRNIIKALALGISATMISQPIAAYASDNGDDDDSSKSSSVDINESIEKADIADVKTEAGRVDAMVEAAVEKVEDVVATVEGTAADADKLLDTEAADKAVQDVRDALKLSEGADTTETHDAIDAEFGVIASDLTAMSKYETAAFAGVGAMERVARDANTIVDEAQNLENETNKAVEAAESAVAGADEKLTQAESDVAAADELNEAEKTKKDLEGDVTESIAGAGDEITKAETAISDARDRFEDLQFEYDKKVANHAELLSEVEAAEKEYNDLKEESSKQAKGAGEKLGILADSAETLAEEAKKALVDCDRYERIAEIEKGIDDKRADERTWKDYDNLFKAIIEDYYVPEILSGTVTDIILRSSSGTYVYENGNIDTFGNVLNYFEVIYSYVDENGDTQTATKRLNYKLADNRSDKASTRGGGLIIFEKTDKEGVYKTKQQAIELTEGELAAANAGEFVEKKLTDNTVNVLYKDDSGVISGYDKANGKQVFTETSFKNESATEEEIAAAVERDGSFEVIARDDSEEVVSYSFEDGKLLKTVTANVVTTIYSGASLDGTVETAETPAARITATRSVRNMVLSVLSLNKRGTVTTVYTNDNYFSGNITFAEYENNRATGEEGYTYFSKDTNNKVTYTNVGLDDEIKERTEVFREKVANTEKADEFKELIEKAEESGRAVSIAEAEVNDLKGQIDKLSIDVKDNLTVINELKCYLSAAEEKLEKVKSDKENLDKRLQEAIETSEEKIVAYTPAPVVESTGEDRNEAPAAVIIEASVPRAQAPAPAPEVREDENTGDTTAVEETENAESEGESGSEVTGTEENGTGGSSEETGGEVSEEKIADEATARASGPAVESTSVDDEEPALADSVEKAGIPWWWMFLMVVLGTTGTRLYEKHLEKKKAKESIEK